MANVPISGLPAAAALTGAELVPVVQGGVTSQSTAQDIADLANDTGITQLTGAVTAGPGSGSQVASIANNAITTAKILSANVTLAKISNAGANSVLVGAGAAGLGASYSEITLGAGLAMTGTVLSSTGSGGITQLTGDIAAGPGSGAQAASIAANAVITAKIANSAVTLAKIANAAANSVLVGAGSVGLGAAYTEITLGSGLTMTAGVLSATAASNIAYDNPTNYTSAMGSSGSLNACKGVDFTCLQAFTLAKAGAQFSSNVGATYKMVLCTINAGGLISAVVSSTSITTIVAATGNLIFDFPSLPVLVVGTRYVLALVRTDSTTNFVLPIWATSSATCIMGIAPVVLNGGAVMAQNAPAAAQTFTQTVGTAYNVIFGMLLQ